jgi:hypothetical protein
MAKLNYNNIRGQIHLEFERLMAEDHLPPEFAWQMAYRYVAYELGMDAEELRRRINEFIIRLRLKGNPVKWESIRYKYNQRRLAKEELWHAQPELFEAILKALFSHDPYGFCDSKLGATEYSLEVRTILPRLSNTMSYDEVLQVVREEFTRWLGEPKIRDQAAYEAMARDIWTYLQEHK